MTPLSKVRRARHRGSAILMALAAIMILSASIIVWASYIRHTLAVSGENYNDTEARAMAHSGLAIAMHPLVSKETPALMIDAENDPGFQVRLISEGAKLNVNFLLAGEDPAKLDLFKRWLESKGIEFQERERMVDCMLDWLDADNLKRLNGEEDSAGYHPPNRGQFQSVEEIAEVAGTEPLISQPEWKNELTVFSQGPIDLASADAPILGLLPGVGEAAIERFLQWRRGPDGLDGTVDDPQIQKLEEVQAFLGLNKTQWAALAGFVGLKDSTWQILSKGWSGKVIRQVGVVVRKGSQNPQILSWKE